MGEPDDAAVFHLLAEVLVQRRAERAVAGHVDIGHGLVRRQRIHVVIGHDLVVATERFDEADIARRGQADRLDASRVQEVREAVRGLAGGRGQQHALRAKEFVLGEKVSHHER